MDAVTETAQFEELLRASDLRVTRPRVAVLSAVYAHPHADTSSIIGFVREDEEGVSHQTVYNALNALTVAGLLRQIQPPGSVPRYESQVADNHHHLVCRGCGLTVDVDHVYRLEAHEKIVLKCGESTIVMTPDGVWINGKVVKLNCSDKPPT